MNFKHGRTILVAGAAAAFLTLSAYAGWQPAKPPEKLKPVAVFRVAKPPPERSVDVFDYYERDLKRLGFCFKETEPHKVMAEETELQATLGQLRSGCTVFADAVAWELSFWSDAVASFGNSPISPIRIYSSELPSFIADRLPEGVSTAFKEMQDISGTHSSFILSTIHLDQLSNPSNINHELIHDVWNRLPPAEKEMLRDYFQKEPIFQIVFQKLFFSSGYLFETDYARIFNALRSATIALSSFGSYAPVDKFLQFEMDQQLLPLISFGTIRDLASHSRALSKCADHANWYLALTLRDLDRIVQMKFDSLSSELFAYGLSALEWGASDYYSKRFLDYLRGLKLGNVQLFAHFLDHYQTSVPNQETKYFYFVCGLRSEIVDRALDH